MSTGIDLAVFAGTDPIYTIAEELFSAMIDGEPGMLTEWFGPRPELTDTIHAWVDVHGGAPSRVLLTIESDTAMQVTRLLLAMDADEPVGDADFVDALGEVANVVGGNIKALVPDPGALTLPIVSHTAPQTDGSQLLHEAAMAWRGRPLAISLWSLP